MSNQEFTLSFIKERGESMENNGDGAFFIIENQKTNKNIAVWARENVDFIFYAQHRADYKVYLPIEQNERTYHDYASRIANICHEIKNIESYFDNWDKQVYLHNINV